MRKNKGLINIKDVLKNAINDNFYKFGYKVMLLKKKWVCIVGISLSQYTSPEGIKNKTLIVNCIHQGWVSTLQFHKEEILKNIKKTFDDYLLIEDIVFKFGKMEKINESVELKEYNIEKEETNLINNENKEIIKDKEDLLREIRKYFEERGKKDN